MTEFLITNEAERRELQGRIYVHPFPYTVTISEGGDRSKAQNRLAFKWYKEISQQSGHDPIDIRAMCKLELGVPIRREDDENFRQLYDEMVKPLPIDKKRALMVEPFDMAVTRDMTVKQMARYLDAIWQFYAVEMGMKLTEPDPMVGDLPSHVKETAA